MKTSFLKIINNSVKHWYLHLISGLLFIATGIYTFASPLESYLALSVIFSITFLVSGIGEIVFSISNRNEIDSWGWNLVFGIFTLLVGVLLIVKPEISVAMLPLYVFYVLLVFAFFMIAVSTLNLFLPTYVISVGFSVEQSAFVASAIMLGVTIGKVLLGSINDRSSLAGVLTSTGLGILGFIFLLMGKEGMAWMTIGGFLFGWAYAGVTVETALLVRTVFGTKDYSKIFSNISIALALGGAIMAGAWGYLADFLNFKIILSIGIVLLLISGLIGLYVLRVNKNNSYAVQQ